MASLVLILLVLWIGQKTQAQDNVTETFNRKDWNEIHCRNGGSDPKGWVDHSSKIDTKCSCPYGFEGNQCSDWACHQGGVCNATALEAVRANYSCQVEPSLHPAKPDLTHCIVRCATLCPHVAPRSYCRVEGVVSHPCVCPAGVEGKFCTHAKRCHHGSLVTDEYSNQTLCLCNRGFKGATCDELDHSYCGFHGEMLSNGTCLCRRPFFGHRCQSFCENGGIVFDEISDDNNGTLVYSKKCVCTRGFFGEFCHKTSGSGKGPLNTVALCLIISIPLTLQGIILALIFYHFKKKRTQRTIAEAVETALELRAFTPSQIEALALPAPLDLAGSGRLEPIQTLPDLIQSQGEIPPLPSYEEVMGTQEDNDASVT